MRWTLADVFENGLKHQYEIVDGNNNLVVKGKYLWSDDRNYQDIAERSTRIRIESYSKVDESFRDASGNYKCFENDSIVWSESYVNTLSSNGEIISTDFINHLDSSSYTEVRECLDKDPQGNCIKLVILTEGTKNLKWLEIRSFEYYE